MTASQEVEELLLQVKWPAIHNLLEASNKCTAAISLSAVRQAHGLALEWHTMLQKAQAQVSSCAVLSNMMLLQA